MPPEYASFVTKDLTQCKSWLSETHPDLYSEIYGEAEPAKEGESAKEGEPAKEGEEKKEGAEEKPKKKVKFGKGEEGIITVFKLSRGGRKVQSVIKGMEHYTKDMKGLASKFGKKFSCGSAVAEDDIYGEHIQVQGDVEDRLLELLENDKDLMKLEIPVAKIKFEAAGNKKGRKK